MTKTPNIPEPGNKEEIAETKFTPLNLAKDHEEYLQILADQGCPYCQSDEVVWEEDDSSYYCENCHSFI